MQSFDNAKTYAPIVLRYAMGLVFLWFGINQLINPNNFIGYLPTFIFNSSYAVTFVYANGIFEIIAGTLLILGILVRWVAALLALHLIAITFDLGYSELAVRDFGLAVATIAIWLWGEDTWCLGKKWKKKITKK